RRVQLPVSFPRTEKLRQQRRHIGDRPGQLASRTRPLVRPKVQVVFGQRLQHPSKSGRFILPETDEKFAVVHSFPPGRASRFCRDVRTSFGASSKISENPSPPSRHIRRASGFS